MVNTQENKVSTDTTLHLFCGKMAAGKTTLAKSISQKLNVVMLGEDKLLLDLYPGKVVDIPSYVKYSNLVRQAISSHVVELLKLNMSVILDFPGNTRQQRQWFLDIGRDAGVLCTLHMIESSDELCISRLAQRAKDNPERQATDTVEMFESMSKHFEPPTMDEGFIIEYCNAE